MIHIKPRTAILSLIVLSVIVFYRTLFAHFVLWDDDFHLFRNPYLIPVTWGHIAHFWTHPYENLYIPVSYTVYSLLTMLAIRPAPDFGALAGPTLTPGVFHFANVVLHCANVTIVFLILRTLTRRNLASAVGAALFAVHPLQVESVAWVSELRGLLCAVFALSSIYSYLIYSRWMRAKNPGNRAIRYYIVAMVLMVLAMLSKPSAAPLPLVFFVIDYWIFGRPLKTAAVATLPWLLALLPFVLITQTIQPTGSFFHLQFWQKPFVAADALAFYLCKLVAPIHLITEYGRRPDVILSTGIPYWDWIVPALAAVLLYLNRRTSKLFTAGGLIALAFILPVLGLSPFIYQRFSTVADRYCYLPMLGVALIVAAFLTLRPSQMKVGVSACVLLVFAGLSFHQVTYWDNTIKLLGHTVAVNPKSAGTWANLGSAYEMAGNDSLAHERPAAETGSFYDQAMNAMQTSLGLDGSNNLTMRAIGDVYMQEHNYPAAESWFYRSLNLDSRQPKIRASLGEIYYTLGDTQRAIAEYAASLQLDPTNAQVREDLAGLLINQGDYLNTAKVIIPVIVEYPKYMPAHKTFGIALERIGMLQKAKEQFDVAVDLNTNDPEAHLLRGVTLVRMNKLTEGQADIGQAKALISDLGTYRSEYGGVLKVLGINVKPTIVNRPK